LGLFANLRPIKICPELIPSSPLKKEIIEQVDLLTVRELTGGLYFGKKSREIGVDGEEVATDTLEYSSVEIKRILKFAFEAARQRRKKVTSVDKANVLTSSQLWRENAEQMRRDYPDVHLEHMYVDNCAMQLVKNPAQFDVIVTENMFGDILTDQASVLSGSLGMLPSASLGGKTGLYEPAHGSAPELAGQNIANPLATILSTALLFRFSLHHEAAAGAIEQAVAKVLAEGYRTSDLYVPGTTQVGAREMGELVTKFLKMV
jgi:3-isopropylmalate dehydrogenase